MIKHNGPISGIACSKNYVATAGYDNQIILWDRLTTVALQRGLHDHLANRCEFSKDEKYLVSASSDYSARLWALPEMQLVAVFSGHNDDVEAAKFSPCGNFVATTSQDAIIRIFDLTGRLLHSLVGHQNSVYACAWSDDGTTIVSSSDDATIRTWCTSTGKCLNVQHLKDVQTDAIAINRQGVVFAGNDNGELIRIEGNKIDILKVHNSGIKNIVIDPENKFLISLSYDKCLGLVEISTEMTLIKQIKVPSVIWARSAAFLDSDHIAFATFGSSYATLDLKNEKWDMLKVEDTECLNSLYVKGDHVFTVGDAGIVKVHQDSQSSKVGSVGTLCNFITEYQNELICGGHMGIIYNAQSGAPLIELKCPINKAIQVGDLLIAALYTGEIAVIKKEKNQCLELIGEFKVLKNAVKDISNSNQILFCVGAAGDVAYFDLDNMRIVNHIATAHDAIINSSTLVKNNIFASVGRDRKLNIWSDGDRIASIQTPHDHSVKCVSASTDGTLIACGSYDGKVAIYNTEKKSWLKYLRVTSAGISSIKYGEKSFWATSYDGRVYEVMA